MAMIKQRRKRSGFALVFILLIGLQFGLFFGFSEAGKGRIHITDDLDDVVDDEEDDEWREWGKKKSPDFDPPPEPEEFSKMDVAEMQAEMLKRQTGPVFGFAKLRLGTRRTSEMVSELAMKWTNLAKTGGVQAHFMGFDVSTIMFTMEKGQDTIELKEFILSQPDAYEIKIGDQFFRRPGDPPFDQVFDEHQSVKSGGDQDKHTEL
ncbi:OLC1v1039282C1 [Oldenlandia corymbosa var. corymbosa]|uniref:OLC1v1039282C1 n=1 Tax=Oldenlandia corymbosa var. corymbosa TaxID=529605 RepID=A0AAV1D2Q1_OLDCO|nr:OLC1v1039282C1 [Oldenlandia corymbosa var. corymbosa]